jgi:hypothetical protein
MLGYWRSAPCSGVSPFSRPPHDVSAIFQEAEGIEALGIHGGEYFAVGGSGELVGGLFGGAKGGADFAVALAVVDAFGELSETRGKGEHRLFEACFRIRGRRRGRAGDCPGRGPVGFGFRGGGLVCREIEVVNVVPMMADLAPVEIPSGVAHGGGAVGGAFGGIK